MLYDAKWVSEHAQCSDGDAWGRAYVENGAKELAEAVAGFERADWLLWFLVRAGVLSIEMAYDVAREITRARVEDKESEVLLSVLDNPIGGPATVIARAEYVSREAASEANIRMQIGAPESGHELLAVSFLARMKSRLDGADLALKDAQCVFNSLAAAETGSIMPDRRYLSEQRELCEMLRSRVIVKAGS